jgi:hypothetical protein
MNDTELDQLLNTWEAPMPPRTLRSDLRDRFPRAERRWFGRPLRWVLVGIVACATLAIGTEQGSGRPFGWLFERLRGFYESFMYGVGGYQAAAVRNQIRASNPQVYVDGHLAGPIIYKGGATLWVDVPGDRAYGVSTYHDKNWPEAGRVHDNLLEFQAGGHQVRIVCDKPVVESDLPVYWIRQP